MAVSPPDPEPETPLSLSNSNTPVSALSSDTGTPLPVVETSETGTILCSLLTFILPVPPVLPATVDETM
jgi:hypothetical protein